MKRGLVAGRFQPFHKGHLALVRQALSECDELIIVVGSAQFNFIDKDPFTAGERLLMIHNALGEAGINLSKCYIIPFNNDENNARWIGYLRSQVPPFEIIYSGNEFVAHLASVSDRSLTIRKPEFEKKDEYSGTNIRHLIASGGPWRNLVPSAVAKVIEEVGGVERISILQKSDTNPARW